MGLRFQKSFNLGAGFKINLSKSGIGYSWGVPGIRTTKLCNGRRRTTLNIPRTGISYITEHSNQKRDTQNITTKPLENQINNHLDLEPTEDILISDINTHNKKTTLIKNILYCCSIIIFITFVAIQGIIYRMILPHKVENIAIILSCIIAYKLTKLVITIVPNLIVKSIQISYDLDADYEKIYSNITKAISLISDNKKIWLVTSILTQYKYKNIYIEKNFKGCEIEFKKNAFKTIKTNIDYYGFNTQKFSVYFLPDRILYIEEKKVTSLKYSELYYDIDTIQLTEPERKISDAQLVRKKWLHTNKDGSPDKRYNNNFFLPVYQYAQINICVSQKTMLTFYCSSIEKTIKAINFIKENKYNIQS